MPESDHDHREEEQSLQRSSAEKPSRRGDRNESQTVLRACEVLKVFRSLGEELTLTEVIERARLPKTTVFRLLRTLIHGGLLERATSGVYRNRFGPVTARPFRIGFAAQGDSEFSRTVMQSIETAAARERIHLITVNNRYSAREALRNADLLIKERVDLVLEFQTYERVAPVIASKFLEANTPVVAIEIPHPGATYFGANNYKAGLIGGKAF
jgi:ribose transport system substrate-binding protein